eukprot:Hpha_TRINITY_DN15114_c3_g3::TRINITY_DN15114_c3_g3_i3::g.127072::m.127072
MASQAIAPARKGDRGCCYVIDSGTGQCRLLRLHSEGDLVALYDLGELPLLQDAVTQSSLSEWEKLLRSFLAADQSKYSPEDPPRQLNLACSAWYRKLSEEKCRLYEAAFAVASQVASSFGIGYSTLLLKEEEEARFELAAVRYAAGRVLGYVPDVVVSGGKGSSQISFRGRVVSLDLPLAEAATLVVDAKGQREWRDRVDRALEKADLASWGELPPNARTVAISGFFYGAKAAGLPLGAGVAPVSCAEAIAHLDAAVLGQRGTAQDTANWIRMSRVIGGLPFDAGTQSTVMFAREWVIGGVPFRTTWSAGMFVEERPRLIGAEHKCDKG